MPSAEKAVNLEQLGGRQGLLKLWSKLSYTEFSLELSITEVRFVTAVTAGGSVKFDCKTFTTQTFTTSDVHHPQCKISRSPPPV